MRHYGVTHSTHSQVADYNTWRDRFRKRYQKFKMAYLKKVLLLIKILK